VDVFEELREKIQRRKAATSVIGLGYVGLPLAVLEAQAGYTVTGIESNPQRAASINRGGSYIEDVPDEELGPLVKSGKLRASGDFAEIANVDVVSICVPTPLDRNKVPDISYVRYVVDQSQEYWHPGQLIVLESTTYPGTTEEVIVPRLEAKGLKVGRDVFVAFSPERIDPGNVNFPVRDVPRVVGGVTPRCTQAAHLFYKQILRADVMALSSPRVAEMTKLFENTFRVVNVSLVNELAQVCERMGIDVWEVIEAAKTKPYGFMPFYPGPGVGGHCIPVDPFFLSWKAKEFEFTTRFIELAGEINDHMPEHVTSQVGRLLNDRRKPINGSKVLLIGMAFKRNVGDVRESASVKVAEHLLRLGAELSYHDPYVPSLAVDGKTLHSVALTSSKVSGYDIVVITTDHSNVDYALLAEASQLIYDTRNAMSKYPSGRVYRLGAPDPKK